VKLAFSCSLTYAQAARQMTGEPFALLGAGAHAQLAIGMASQGGELVLPGRAECRSAGQR
jgi:hypothetical protein